MVDANCSAFQLSFCLSGWLRLGVMNGTSRLRVLDWLPSCRFAVAGQAALIILGGKALQLATHKSVLRSTLNFGPSCSEG